LIFPYPCVCDHDESVILTALKFSSMVFGDNKRTDFALAA
jgi:hypothetical protein